MRAPRLFVFAPLMVSLGCDEPPPSTLPEPPLQSTVSITKEGDGVGVVRTDPIGLLCDTACESATFVYEETAAVTMIAEEGRNANFKVLHCSADGQPEQRTTTVDENDRARLVLPTIVDDVAVDWDCGAEFLLVHTLQVIAAQGGGSGRVTGSLSAVIGADEPKRMDCPSTESCVASYFDGDVETLTATADAGSVFERWVFCNSDDSTNPVATFTMTGDLNCRADFAPAP
jgi:hypothetical protein